MISQVLKKYPSVESAILFGSRALGRHKRASDIDLSLKGEKLTDRVCAQIHSELEEETCLPYFFDINCYQNINNEKLKQHIDRAGRLLYSKTGD